MSDFLQAARDYSKQGFSVIPVHSARHKKPDMRKRPTISSWKPFQERIITAKEVEQLFGNGSNIALVTGTVSGNLEVIDFDEPELFGPVMETIQAHNPDLAGRLITAETPSGGYHLIYRCHDPVPGNQKLARSADGKKTLIETRGQGGYFLAAPSEGYTLNRALDQIPTISKSERDTLIKIAASFSEYQEPKYQAGKQTGDGNRPSDIFNQEARWNRLLEVDGWKYERTIGDRERWIRPGKESGCSATLHPEHGLFVFSSSTNLPTEKPLDKFGYLAHARFSGDFTAAANYVREQFPHEFPQKTASGHSGHSGHSGREGVFPDNPDRPERFPDEFPDERAFFPDEQRSISNDVREYVFNCNEDINFIQLCQHLGLHGRRARKTANDALAYLVKKEKLRKHPIKTGVYQMVNVALETMKPKIDKTEPLPLSFPLGFHNDFKLKPGTVVVIGGATNAGKTLMAMDILRRWIKEMVVKPTIPSGKNEGSLVNNNFSPSLREFNEGGATTEKRLEALKGVRYVNSEMTEEELGSLLADMGPDGEMLLDRVEWVKRTHDYPNAVLTDGITILDYLQIYENFYEIGAIISEMADRVGKGLLVVLIQKKSGESFPRGGEFAIERARVGLLLDYAGPNVSSCYLRKIKYPQDPRNNPEGKEVEFTVGDYLALKPVSDLRRLTKSERAAAYSKYGGGRS